MLKNKLPLTKAQKKYGLANTTMVKYHYQSAELLLQGYHEYMQKFQDRKEKPSTQYQLTYEIFGTQSTNLCVCSQMPSKRII